MQTETNRMPRLCRNCAKPLMDGEMETCCARGGHIFEHETEAYRACMARVDELDADEARAIIKRVLDTLYAEGEGTNDNPRRINAEKEWNADTLDEIGGMDIDMAPRSSDEDPEEA